MHREREHYVVTCRLDGLERSLLWYSDDADGVLVGADGVVAFDSPGDAAAYAEAGGLSLKEEPPAFFDLDRVQAWLSNNESPVDCIEFLACWNLLTDIAACLGAQASAFRAHDQAASSVYEKLFFGNNLPAVTPAGCSYEPAWSEPEVALLSSVLSSGIELARAALAEAA